MNFHPEQYKIVEMLTPATDAAGRTGSYISLKNVNRAFLVFHVDQGAADTIKIEPKQASAVAGTGVKVLANSVPIWTNLDCAAGDVFTRQTDAVNYTTDAGIKHKIVIFQIDPSQLDVAGGFDCITIVTGASNVANITEATAILDTKYGAASPVITD